MSGTRVLSLSCVFPTRDEPLRGVFVQHRLAALADLLPVQVIAPVGVIRWGASGLWRFFGQHVRQGRAEAIVVEYPRWLYLPSASWANSLLLALQVLPLLLQIRRRQGWDVLDAHFGQPAGVAAALLASLFQCPFTVTLRGLELEEGKSGLARIWMGWSLRRAAHVFAVSKELRAFALSLGVTPQKSTVSMNGVDCQIFHPGDRKAARQRLLIPDDARLVFAAGRLNRVKGLMDLMEAVEKLASSCPKLQLVIAGGVNRGSAAQAQELASWCRSRGLSERIRFEQELPQQDLAEWMRAADVFCLASWREGCPNVVLEALACGLPVVATRVGAIPDLIPSTDYGLIVDPRNPVALAAGLEHALNKEWNRDMISEHGQFRSWARVAEELKLVLDDLVSHELQTESGSACSSR
jgi:teichuronic acid biosynthesis glycosyltransferase TuaC